MNMQQDGFDLGPLTWVKPELDNALLAARAALGGWNGEDTHPLKTAAAHLHQVYGALQIVDLRGVSLLTAATEQLLEEMSKQASLRTQASLDATLAAIDAIHSFLDGLMAGAPPAELKLTPVYRAVVTQRGADAPAPSELFFPNTDARPPKRAAEPLLDDRARAATIRAARASYQRGLLQLLQNKDPQAGVSTMEMAVRKVEELAPGATQYAFWWSAVGLMEALGRQALPVDFWLKRLCGRIDLQMRRLKEGSRQLAERLFNDVLYYVAQDPVPSGRTAEVNDLYRLRRYFPSVSSALPEEMLPFVASLKDHLNSAKDHWMRYCGGRADSLEAFQAAASGLFEAALHLPNQAMKDLARIIQAVAKRMPGVGDASHNEALQVEMATALLLGINAADHFEALGDEFKRQVEVQAMRVQAAIDPTFKTETIPQVDLLDEFSKAAQEKLLLAQVNHEIQANLHRVEEILDKFFRNEQERGGLPTVPVLLKQIQGALDILQLDVASALVAEAIERIGHFDEMNVVIPPANLNWVAEALSTLGLYMDALRYGRDDPTEMQRLLATPEAQPQPRELSVEVQARAEAQRLAEAVHQWLATGGDEAAKSQLKTDLAALMRDAELVGDDKLRAQAESLRQALESTGEQAGAAAAAMTQAKVAPSVEIQRLAEAPSEVVDRELLETYIDEANEVLATIAVQVSRLQVSPYDHEAFTVVRRGFHTLKGSGRMVGLTSLAEPAWEVEQTLNLWLRDERTPTPELLAFLEEASNAFQVWVMELEEQGQAQVKSSHLVEQARRLRGEAAPQAPIVEADPPPKPDADAPADASTAVGEHETPMRDAMVEQDVDLDGHVLPAELFEIYTQEAGQRLQDLAIALAEMAQAPRHAPWEAFIRGAHTLAGISRTTGLTPLAEAAHALEIWSGGWPDKTQMLPSQVVAGLENVLQELSGAYAQVRARHFPSSLAHVERMLAALQAPAPVPAPGAGPAPEEVPVQGLAAPAPLPAPVTPAATSVLDQLDEQLLPIFLEEAEELLPRIGEALRQWRAQPVGGDAGDALKRVLHTLKGSARMAGAMRLGERIHGMETRVMEHADGIATSAYLDELEEEYDRIHDMVEGLRTGSDLPAPELAPPPPHHEAAEAWDLTPASIAAQEAEMAREIRAVLDHMPAGSPAAKTPVAEELPTARDEIDEQLLPVFLEEADELLPRIGEALRDWRAQPDRPEAGEALKRVLHTLKGSARMAGAMTLGERVHDMENQVLGASGGTAMTGLLDHLEEQYDRIQDMVEGLRAGAAVAPITPATPLPQAQPAAALALKPAPGAKAGLEEDLRLRQALRMKSAVLDTLLNEAGEVAIARARIENVLKGYRQTTQELAANVERLRAQLRELEIQAETQMHSRLSQMEASEFDPLEFDRFSRLQELTRQLAESVNDVSTAQDNLLTGLNEADNALIQQGRMARTLQQELMHMRMVPLNTLAERLYRVVRQSAKETGRRAQLELEGGQTELDRVVLDKIAAPLEHLVRNAVAHGVEPPAVRAAAGKQEYGEIRLAARQEGNEIVLTLSDDGAGVDAEAVRAKAVEHGWLAPDEAINPEQVETFLFRSGFSTAQVVTELAGRGVGLDVVKNDIASIGGRIRMETTPGQGTRFTIRLPLTLALTQVVLAVAGDQTWALPANLIAMVRVVKAKDMRELHAQGYLEFAAERYPLRTLAELVAHKPNLGEGRSHTVLLVKAGESRLALSVDALEGNLEAVVKPIGPQLARISGISGATVLGDGRVALILNPFQLADRAPTLGVTEEEAAREQAPLIMVVDDSLTVRKITSRLLLREGYRVVTAKSGIEALELLQQELPAVMLLDIEMPRMDGFELTKSVRADARMAGLPIIMITSRTAEKHRSHALELGVNAYLGKPYQDEELLDHIARFIAQTATA